MRLKHHRSLGLFLAFLFICAPLGAFDEPFSFSKDSRVLVIAPHPDDETLGTGGLIQSALEAGGDVKVVYLTHGDYNEIASIFFQKKPLLSKSDFIKSGLIRRKEAIEAMSVIGLDQRNLVFLGYPDFGTLNIWSKHWGERKPYRSFITRINKVPYKDDFSYGRPYRGDNIVSDIEKILLLYRPTHVLVTAPFDLNTDHRAAYLYLHVALFDLQGKINSPKVLAYLIHEHRWPVPRKYEPNKPLEPPSHISDEEGLKWITFNLKPAQVESKNQALLKYESQIAYSRDFMLSFARTNELYCEPFYEKLNISQLKEQLSFEKDKNETNSNEVNYWVQGNELWLDIRVSSPIDELGPLNMEIFGYKHDTDFAKMPKLNLILLGGHLWARDGYKRLPDSGVHYDLRKKSLRVRIPLELLKSSDHLFVSTRTMRDDLSLDFGSWRILEMPELVNGKRQNLLV